jgi:hypothetical protein
MRIDLKKLTSLEASLAMSKDGVVNTTSLFTLREMISLVLQYRETGYELAPNNVKMAFNTLKQMGIIKDTPDKEVQQLNS